MERKRKKPTRDQINAIIGRDELERWERVKRMFEERLDYHRRRKLQNEQAADGR
jgi:hypothetical protein